MFLLHKNIFTKITYFFLILGNACKHA